MATYKIIKGHMTGGFGPGDTVTTEQLEDFGVGEDRAISLGVVEPVEDAPANPDPVPTKRAKP
jgi:hypothetical protein